MQKEWSSFRITILLYVAVLILPLSFYFVYTSFETMQQDTKAIRQTSWLAGAIGKTTSTHDPKIIQDIDKTFQNLSLWAEKNSDTELYPGANILSEDFSKIKSCWIKNKNNLTFASTQCYALTESLALNVEQMVYLKQNKIINIFYISLTLGMMFILLIIYLVRTYIRIQMKKHAIHDHETKLFNKKYFLAELKSSCARATRNNSPLSVLSISVNDLKKEDTIYDKNTREHILKRLGGLIISLTRESDVASRYDEDLFSILLPDTSEENALILKKRIHEAFEKHDFGVSPELHFKFATAHLNDEESSEAFRVRTEKLLK